MEAPSQPWGTATIALCFLSSYMHPQSRGEDPIPWWDDISPSPRAFPELAWGLSLPHPPVCHSTTLFSPKASLPFLTVKAYPCLCPRCLLFLEYSLFRHHTR